MFLHGLTRMACLKSADLRNCGSLRDTDSADRRWRKRGEETKKLGSKTLDKGIVVLGRRSGTGVRLCCVLVARQRWLCLQAVTCGVDGFATSPSTVPKNANRIRRAVVGIAPRSVEWENRGRRIRLRLRRIEQCVQRVIWIWRAVSLHALGVQL